MNVSVRQLNSATVVALAGAIDGNTAPQAQEQILPLMEDGCRLLLDMSMVEYLSSAGLRMLLMLFRRVAECGGQIVLSGVSEEITDTMSLTGFLDFFTTSENVDSGLALLEG